jgi:sugar phosphate isomerase/epimerase
MTRDAIYELIRLAAPFEGHINIGMFRGMPTTADQAPSVAKLVTRLRELADYAARLQVQLLIEPANRKEFPFISTTQEGIDMVKAVDRPNFGLMLDTFHMAVEKEDMCDSIRRARSYLHHIHFLDLDRNPPSRTSAGIDIPAVLATLADSGYQHYLSMPLMKDGGDAATAEVARYLRSLMAAG